MNLGQMLAWHRGLCHACTPARPCSEYLEIIAEFTETRQIWTGPIAASTVLSVREGAAT